MPQTAAGPWYGYCPSVDTLHRMSRYFNLSMDETYEILKRIRQAPSVWLG